MLGLICAGVVLCMTTWFSATAIVPELTQLWNLSSGQVAWLTNAVQLGFVTGALLSSLVNLPDIVPLRRLMGVRGCSGDSKSPACCGLRRLGGCCSLASLRAWL